MPEKSNEKIIRKKYTQGTPGHVLDTEYFYYDTAPTYNKSLAIVCGGYEKCAPDFEINRNNYPYYFIKYTINGKGTLQISTNSYQLTPGVLSGFCSGIPHHYKSDPQDPMEHIFITFVGSNAKTLVYNSTLGSGGAINVTDPVDTLRIMEKILHTGLEKKPHSQQICCNYLRILLLEQAANNAGSNSYRLSMKTYQKCKRFIDNNFSEITSPRRAAKACGINARYMSSLFKRYGSNSPHEYIMRLKLNKAANLLLTSILSVMEIAAQVGFDDPYHFSRNFKKFHGSSPKNYRLLHL